MSTRRVAVWRGVPLFAALLLACSGGKGPVGNAIPEASRFEKEWQRYQRLPAFKALAMAGSPDGRFVIGYSVEEPHQEQARRRALAECELRRKPRSIDEPCRLYALGNEVVDVQTPP